MDVEKLVNITGADFYTGVPDSQLKALCDYLMNTYSADKKHHIIAANEGNCTAIAAGYYLATGKIPVVYMQNSGIGNIINPVASLLNDNVYAIPVIYIIGWRGEPEVCDEPQHIYQGKVTLKLLEDMDISYFVISKDTKDEDIKYQMDKFRQLLDKGKSVAFVVKKGALSYSQKTMYSNSYIMKREDVIKHIVRYSKDDLIVSTTGKASRELYEIREQNNQEHCYDFLTVGSMGHSLSIALGVALNSDKKVWCIDGDGAAVMHLGAMAVTGANNPTGFVHIIINNCAHESVGGMPTVGNKIDFVGIAKSCGYKDAVSVDNFDDLDIVLEKAQKSHELSFIEVKCAIGAREDLGRPKTTPVENKINFMNYIKS